MPLHHFHQVPQLPFSFVIQNGSKRSPADTMDRQPPGHSICNPTGTTLGLPRAYIGLNEDSTQNINLILLNAFPQCYPDRAISIKEIHLKLSQSTGTIWSTM